VSNVFTVDNGLLTSTGKIRREAVLTKYSAEIEAVYAANVRSG
jgi:long-subunit acyl-CoA synthetase (AMP-forming)